MSFDTKDLLLIGIALPFVVVFLSGINGLKRQEKQISDFYWPLREKYPRSYVKQNKVIKFIRKCFGMQTKDNIHWMTCVLHYLQLISVISPIFMLITFLFVPLEEIVVAFLVFGFSFPFGLLVILAALFYSLQTWRCVGIKKKDPKHSKREFYP